MLTSLPPSPTASVKGLPLQDAPQDVVIVVKHGHGQTIHLVITFALLIWHNLTFQLITTHQNFSQLPVILIFRLVSMHQQTALRHLDGNSRSQFLPGTSFRMSSTIPAFCAGDKRQAITSQSHDNQTSDTYRSYRTMMREVCKSTQDMTCKHTHTQTRPIHDELQLDLRRRTIAVIGGLDGFWGQVQERECKPQFIITFVLVQTSIPLQC